MRLKHSVLALAAAGLLAVQAHAGEAAVEAAKLAPVAAAPEAVQAAFSAADIESLFVMSDAPVQIAALSAREMSETEGAVFWFVPVVGWTAGGAALNSLAMWSATGQVTWRDVGAGATMGFWASPITRPFGGVVRFAGGTLGAASWFRP